MFLSDRWPLFDRDAAARYGMNIADVQSIVSAAIGGDNIAETLEVMQRIAAPMVGGMITAPLLSMFVIPAVYLLLRRPRVLSTVHRVQKRTGQDAAPDFGTR